MTDLPSRRVRAARRGRPKGRSIMRFAVLCCIGFGIAIPFVWMMATSFKTRADADSPGFRIMPSRISVDNYPVILNARPDPGTGKKLDLDFGRWYLNSIFYASAICLLQVLTSAMAAYAFSRIKWRGRDTVFLLYLSTMMIPGAVLMIPTFGIMAGLGLVDTYHGLVIPAAFTAFGTFLLRQFMLSIPSSLDEAATIDGANHWTIFWTIIMPLSRPGLVALAIVTFMAEYKSLFWPLIMTQSSQLFTLPVGMLSLTLPTSSTAYAQQTELIMAATVMNIAPMIIVFVIFQKLMVKGLQMGAVKG